MVGESSLICRKSFERLAVPSEKDYQLECPDISIFCDLMSNACPNDCNGNGVCLKDRKCRCFIGHTSDDCSEIDADSLHKHFALVMKYSLDSGANSIGLHYLLLIVMIWISTQV